MQQPHGRTYRLLESEAFIRRLTETAAGNGTETVQTPDLFVLVRIDAFQEHS